MIGFNRSEKFINHTAARSRTSFTMSYHPDPANDPNEAYAVIQTPALRGPVDWWTVTFHGESVRRYPPDKRDLAKRFANDPAYRQRCTNKKKAYD